MSGYAIEVKGVSKYFKMRNDRPRSFQETLLRLLHFDLGRNFEKYWVLQNISFAVAAGELVGIIGPNGAGKSTVLKLISRIIEPTEGTIVVNGKVSSLLELGAGFHHDLTGRENVFLNGSILGLSRREIKRRMNEIVQFSGLERFIDVPVKYYSSGMYMRLGFSVAIHTDPDILVVDEVLAVGDRAFQGQCLHKIKELVDRGTAVLFVSHDMDAVSSLCNKAIWLDCGRIVMEGAADKVVEAYTKGEVSADAAIPDDRRSLERGRCGGSQEARIVHVALLDAKGRERYSFEPGEPVTIRMTYECEKRVKRPVFGLAIFRSDGWHVNGPNTRFADYPIDEIDGCGYVDYKIHALPLLGGVYSLTVSIFDYNLQHPYYYHEGCLNFLVKGEKIKEEFGDVYFVASWDHKAACAGVGSN